MPTPILKANDFRSRNRFLAFVLFILGLVQFSVYVRSAKGDTALQLLSASAFFTMLGAFLVLILLCANPNHGPVEILALIITIGVLLIGAILYLASAIYIANSTKECDGRAGCGARAFGETPMIVSYVSIVIALDLFNQYFQHRRLRIITNSCIILLTSMLMFIYFDKLGHLTHRDKTALAGFAFLFIAAFVTVVVIGIIIFENNKILNLMISVTFYIGLLLVLAWVDIGSSTAVVFWFLLCAVSHLISADVQAGGCFMITEPEDYVPDIDITQKKKVNPLNRISLEQAEKMGEDRIINVNDFLSRNRFQAFVLFIFGLIQFSVVVPNAKDKTDQELWSSSAFFTMLGAFMALILIAFEKYDRFASGVTGVILCVGAIMYFSTGCYWCDKTPKGFKSQNCSKVFGESVLLAAFQCLYLAIDIFDASFAPFNNRRLRVLANSFTIFLTSILMISYFGILDDKTRLSDADKTALSGFVFLMIASFFSFIVVGIFGRDEIALFNAACTFLSYIGIFLVLAYPDTTSSVTIVWWFLYSSVAYIMTDDIQANGTVKIRRSKRSSACMEERIPLSPVNVPEQAAEEEKELVEQKEENTDNQTLM